MWHLVCLAMESHKPIPQNPLESPSPIVQDDLNNSKNTHQNTSGETCDFTSRSNFRQPGPVSRLVEASPLFLARSVSEGDHETTMRQNDRARRATDANSRCHRYSGDRGAIVVPLADASG